MNTVLMAELGAVAWLAAKHLQQLITSKQRVPQRLPVAITQS
jgi:hypothetical protein